MEKSDFKIGQTVILKILGGGNEARYIDRNNPEARIIRKTVTKISKKYITVADDIKSSYGEEKFNITDNFSRYAIRNRDYLLYLSEEDIVKDLEREKLFSEIEKLFSIWGNEKKYTVKQLQKVKEILELTD